LNTPMRQEVRHEALRFLIAGAANTVATYGVYLALLPLLNYAVAYSIAFVAGILLSYLLNTRFVFRVAGSMRRFAMYPLVYVAQYLVGLAVLHAAVALFDVKEELALLASVAVSLPLTFLLSRLVLKAGVSAPTD
jgi:putative flippase GtrA